MMHSESYLLTYQINNDWMLSGYLTFTREKRPCFHSNKEVWIMKSLRKFGIIISHKNVVGLLLRKVSTWGRTVSQDFAISFPLKFDISKCMDKNFPISDFPFSRSGFLYKIHEAKSKYKDAKNKIIDYRQFHYRNEYETNKYAFFW